MNLIHPEKQSDCAGRTRQSTQRALTRQPKDLEEDGAAMDNALLLYYRILAVAFPEMTLDQQQQVSSGDVDAPSC